MTRELVLQRIASLEFATFGVLLDRASGIPFAVTLEDPWLENLPFASCIPPGTYSCDRIGSPKFGETFEVTHVPGRTHVLFHKGNTADDTQGCVLVGEQFEAVNGQPGIIACGKGFSEFLERLRGEKSFQLYIRRPWP